MTPRERAKEATWEAGCPDWGSDDQERLELAVEQAITAAVEAEREECAKIADRRAEGESLLTHITAQGRYDMAKGIAYLIRARSTASDRSAEPVEK